MPAFEHDNDNDLRTSNKRYYIPNVEIKDYNVMIDGKNFFDQGDDYTTGCLLDYTYFKKCYKMI